MNEKEAIEKATADAFIKLYNCEMGTSFSIVEYSDSPDIRCKDTEGNTFNLGITLTENRPKDIQAVLGRSDHKSQEALKKHLEEVKAQKANIFERASGLQDNVTAMIVSRIQPKLNKDYGPNAALVIRDCSRLDWDWDIVTDQIKNMLNLERNPFDKGVWIISCSKNKLFRLI